MTAAAQQATGPLGADGGATAPAPELTFAVTGVEPERHAAVPTLRFTLRTARSGGGPVRAVALTVAVRIEVTRRAHDPVACRALTELFGQPEEWGRTMRPLLWTQAAVQVPPFDEQTSVPLLVPCATDAELAVTKYLRAAGDGEVPLGFLFNGTVFYQAPGPVPAPNMLRTAHIPWSAEASCRLPAGLWPRLVERYHGTDPWLRLPRETCDRLDAYRAHHALGSTDDAVRALLDRSGAP
ncbi:DUF6084 family protein [Streptomyces sp. HNM0663]|uniref:DUF6084 family protein n=1 Tax=Streptomyces chengmaiensis TaxID=3040919 RepID=A0ABT6HQ38_9ACTN|nr:DUF6084 family protein [Streptomyces chengmaiensis]MDH2390836.1 DUF6084 family protein [Streptomyces chengmaiensis]